MVEVYLRELSIEDGEKELEYLRNFPDRENGFENPAHIEDLKDEASFSLWLQGKVNGSKGINLKEGRVPQTIYWIMVEDKIVGIGKLRHYLNESLLNYGGNIGYAISSEYRGKGIASKALSLILQEANNHEQEEVLLTVDSDNIASCKVIENNGGILKKEEDGTCFYWIKIKDKHSKTV